MLGFPQATEFNKRIPKQKFYENLAGAASLKKAFAEQIKTIYWRNKLSVATLSIDKGEAVGEIEVLELKLSKPFVDEAVLRQIDKQIPYHIVFALTCEDKVQVRIGYKQAAAPGSSVFKVGRYYCSEWVKEGDIRLSIEGLNMDAIYENLVRQVAGEALSGNGGESLQESVERDERRRQLQRQLEGLEIKLKREKQLNIRVEINAEIKKLKAELEKYKTGGNI